MTHANEASGRDDAATDEDVIGNAAESKSPALKYPSDQLHPSLMEDCNQLGNVVKMNEILDPNPKPEDNNNNVFEHLMHHYFDSQNLVSNPPSPAADYVPLEATLLEQLEQDAADLQEAPEALDRLSEEDTLAQWMKEVQQNGQPSKKRLKKGSRSRTRPVTRSRGPWIRQN